MYYGEIEIGGQGEDSNDTKPIAQRVEETSSDLFKVSYVTIAPQKRSRTVNLRGRTKADAVIPIRAETGGVLEKRHVNRGDFVKEGDLVCEISSGARIANLESAKTRLAQVQADFAANQKLLKKGFTTKSQMRQIQFDLNAAKAQVKQVELELSHTKIKANASGVVQDPIASPGDVLAIGGACVTLVDSDPMFFTGQLPESDIDAVAKGMKASIKLVTGEETTGEITYIAPSTDPQTRTFLTDIKLESNGKKVRGGLTASAAIKLEETSSFRISPSWLTLADDGTLGVKTIDDQDKVQFNPVKVLSQTNDGFWIEGLEEGSRIITLGQEYVVDGETVEPVPDQKFAEGVQG
jgi:multidrug efflux system membrane fusion protein